MRSVKGRSSCLLLVIGLIFHGVGWSNGVVPEGYRNIAAEQGIPHTIFYAIALTESATQIDKTNLQRPWPWTLNVAGHGYFYNSRHAAWRALKDWLHKGRRSIDIGLMQVNWRYHQERLGTPWQALNPYHNLRVGAAVLKACYQRRQDWWSSVGCYHSPSNPRRADRYRRRVVSHWRWITKAG